MLSNIIRKRFPKCRSLEEFSFIRNELNLYGKEKFYTEMEQEGAFVDRVINIRNNPFGQMLLGYKKDEFEKIENNYILAKSLETPRHKFLIPRVLSWETFNVLTLDESHIYMIEEMKKIGLNYGKQNNYLELGLYFHCYPYNTVQCLHLHIVDLLTEPEAREKENNLDIDIVLNVLKL